MQPDQLTEYWRERYEERAAIMEHDAKMPPDVANERAMQDIKRCMALEAQTEVSFE